MLRRGPKRGLTASTIATRGELNLNTVRSLLWELSRTGTVSVIGTANDGTVGRPSNLYALAA